MTVEDRWLLPEGVGEVLPPEAERLEALRRAIVDLFQSWGYELCVPPLIEYLESLLTGTGHDLDLETFKITDQMSGRLMGVRADMTASWLAQMGWETYVLEGGYDGTLEIGPPHVIPKPDPSHRYRRPYEGTDIKESAMQAYLDWEYGLVEQLRRDATHGFFVI